MNWFIRHFGQSLKRPCILSKHNIMHIQTKPANKLWYYFLMWCICVTLYTIDCLYSLFNLILLGEKNYPVSLFLSLATTKWAALYPPCRFALKQNKFWSVWLFLAMLTYLSMLFILQSTYTAYRRINSWTNKWTLVENGASRATFGSCGADWYD